MYIKTIKSKNKKTGKEYIRHVLVESVRYGKTVKKRHILNLGRLELPKELWPALSEELSLRLRGEQTLEISGLKVDKRVKKAADKALEKYYARKRNNIRDKEVESDEAEGERIEISLDKVNNGYSRNIGAELVCDNQWRQLGLGELLKELGFKDKDIVLAEAAVIGRLISPGSELSTWNWFNNISGLPEILEVEIGKVGINRFYKVGDLLLNHKEEIEKHLRKHVERSNKKKNVEKIYLFDLTNFYFRGQGLGNSLCSRGKSKEKRDDCPLVSLGLVVDEDGFPIYSKIFPGNISEPSTMEDVLREMGILDERNLPGLGITLVMDRGIATRENVKFLKEHGIPYILITRGPRNQYYLEEFKRYKEDDGFKQIEKNGYKIYVKKKKVEEDKVEVLCISENRQHKEESIRLMWQERAMEDLARLQTSIRSRKRGTVKDISKIHIRIGRLHERYPGFRKYFHYEIVEDPNNPGKAMDLKYEQIPIFDIDKEEANPLSGSYVIETTHVDKSPEEIWSLYMTLNRVEKAFRSMKSDLGTRPIYHQTGDRTEAHLFISVIAYHLLSHIEKNLKKKI